MPVNQAAGFQFNIIQSTKIKKATLFWRMA